MHRLDIQRFQIGVLGKKDQNAITGVFTLLCRVHPQFHIAPSVGLVIW